MLIGQRQPDCKICGGYMVRLEGKACCGFCGWPEDREVPEAPKHVLPRSDMDALKQRVVALEAENQALRQERETKPVNGEKVPTPLAGGTLTLTVDLGSPLGAAAEQFIKDKPQHVAEAAKVANKAAVPEFPPISRDRPRRSEKP
jgi:hypothetical protein